MRYLNRPFLDALLLLFFWVEILLVLTFWVNYHFGPYFDYCRQLTNKKLLRDRRSALLAH